MNAIQIKNITKRYKGVTALDDVSLSFEFGKIYGFLGRNGAGKSTLINIIANRIFADHGEVLIDGIPAKENMGVHEKIFCMSEADLYDRDLKVKEHFNGRIAFIVILIWRKPWHSLGSSSWMSTKDLRRYRKGINLFSN